MNLFSISLKTGFHVVFKTQSGEALVLKKKIVNAAYFPFN